jgi:hypothetical protein
VSSKCKSALHYRRKRRHVLGVMIRPWEVFNIMSTVTTATSGKNSLHFLSLKCFSLSLYIETGEKFHANVETHKDY